MATTFRKDVYTCSLWVFTVCLAFFWIPVQGDFHLIGSSEPIITAPGDDVILPCHLDSELDVQDWTVEWSKPDIKPSPSERQSRVDVVYLYRVRIEVQDIMIVSYIGRTSLLTEGLKRGDMSLRIRNVTLEDGGRYRCFTPTLGRGAVVRLVVDPNYVKTPTTETALLLTTPEPQDKFLGRARNRLAALATFMVFFVVLCLFAASFCKRRRKQNGDAVPIRCFSAASLCPTAV